MKKPHKKREKDFPSLDIITKDNEIICGYSQYSPDGQGGAFVSMESIGIISDDSMKEKYIIGCSVLISPIHCLTIKEVLQTNTNQLCYLIPSNLRVSFKSGTILKKVISCILLERFAVLTLQDDLSSTIGYTGLVAQEVSLDCSQKKEIVTSMVQGVNYNATSHFSMNCNIYKENEKEQEMFSSVNTKALSGCPQFTADIRFGCTLSGLTSNPFSGINSRITIQRLTLADVLVISEVISAKGLQILESRLDINQLTGNIFTVNEHTNKSNEISNNQDSQMKDAQKRNQIENILDPKTQIFYKSIKTPGLFKNKKVRIIGLKMIRSDLLAAISKQGELFLINILTNMLEARISLGDKPSVIEVIRNELFIGCKKSLIQIEYHPERRIKHKMFFKSQIVSLLSLREYGSINNNQSNTHDKYNEEFDDDDDDDDICLVGCLDGLYLINSDQIKLQIDLIELERVCTIQFNIICNQEMTAMKQYDIFQSKETILMSSGCDILLIRWKERKLEKVFKHHIKSVYFIEQLRDIYFLSGSSDGQILMWNKLTTTAERSISLNHPIYFGFLLSPKELLAVEYNNFRIFNTLTFSNEKYSLHSDPISAFTKVSAHSFLSCDSNNNIHFSHTSTSSLSQFIHHSSQVIISIYFIYFIHYSNLFSQFFIPKLNLKINLD